jgi:hypothetical protein
MHLFGLVGMVRQKGISSMLGKRPRADEIRDSRGLIIEVTSDKPTDLVGKVFNCQTRQRPYDGFAQPNSPNGWDS